MSIPAKTRLGTKRAGLKLINRGSMSPKASKVPTEVMFEKPTTMAALVTSYAAVNTPKGPVAVKDLKVGDAVTPTDLKKTRKVKIVVEESILAIIESIPFEEGAFRFIQCDRKKATVIQQRLYSINHNNAGGRVYATRYNSVKGGLLVWRMD